MPRGTFDESDLTKLLDGLAAKVSAKAIVAAFQADGFDVTSMADLHRLRFGFEMKRTGVRRTVTTALSGEDYGMLLDARARKIDRAQIVGRMRAYGFDVRNIKDVERLCREYEESLRRCIKTG